MFMFLPIRPAFIIILPTLCFAAVAMFAPTVKLSEAMPMAAEFEAAYAVTILLTFPAG